MTIRKTLPGSIAAALMLASAYPAFAADKDAKKDDLQGTWKSKLEGQLMTLKFSKSKFSAFVLTKKLMSGTYSVDATKSPKDLDFEIKEGEPKVIGKSVLCIYEVKEKKLKWCANDPVKANPRPKAFPDKQGSKRNYIYLIFDRVEKAGKKPEKASTKKSDLARLQGDWKLTTGKFGGQDAPPEFLTTKLHVKKDSLTLIRVIGGKERKSTIRGKLDPTKSPKQIDYFKKDGTLQMKGIYKLEGKKVTFCFDREKRPAKFESKAGTRVTLFVFERPKKK